MELTFKDSKPQVGIFEVVDGIMLIDSEDVQSIDTGGGFFDGLGIHLHAQQIRSLVANNASISDETKAKFKSNPSEYLNYPRGRVDYNIEERKYHIMSSRAFFTDVNIEKVLRLFHLPPLGSGNIILEVDEGHYGF